MGEGRILGRVGQRRCAIGIGAVPESWDDGLQNTRQREVRGGDSGPNPLQNHFRAIHYHFRPFSRRSSIANRQANQALDHFPRDERR
jgi:hypothetical protein